MEQFKLTDYLDEARAISENNGCTVTAAVDRMVVNLNTFNEYHKGTGKLNYHVLGQQWGTLTAPQKVAQKQEAKDKIARRVTSENRNRRRL